ncbi:MAG: hypothetical protein GXY77_14730 [Fibrobacter sp.]|nr:hypothetical protein [Fibrobacter sp.]
MRFILAVQLIVLLSFGFISSISSVSAQDDPFAIDVDDWPDIDEPFDDFPEEIDEPKSEPVVEKPPVKEPVVEKPPVKEPVAEKPPVKEPVAEKPPVKEPIVEKKQPIVKPEPVKTVAPKVSIPLPSVNSTVKRSGPPLILISRPVYAPYSTEAKTQYIAAIAESYFHFKIGMLPGFQVLSQEKIAHNLQYFRDFSRRVSRASYIETAKKLGASYLFYQEYEPQGKSVKFEIEVYSLADNNKVLSSTHNFDLKDFEDGLYECVMEIAGELVGSIPVDIQKILGENVLAKSSKSIERFGALVASAGEYSQAKAEAVIPEYEKVLKQESQFHIARYVTAAACAIANQFDKAIEHQDKLISIFGNSYPDLYLQLASYYREGGRHSDAIYAAEKAKQESTLEIPANIEIAMAYEAKGDLQRAQSEYLSILQKGGEDGEIYFQLALVSIGLGNLSQSSQYLSKAASAGRSLDRGDYYDLGLRYAALGTANDKAIEAFQNSMGIQKDNEDAWRQLAELYSNMGRQADAAECYISLFHISNEAYKDYLPKAGMIYESEGMREKAKDAYALFIARNYHNKEVNLRLAKLEVEDGNCDDAVELVYGMDTITGIGEDVRQIMQQCGQPERRVVIPTETGEQKKWAGVFFWRVVSGAVSLGGAGLGYFCNTKIDDNLKAYRDERRPHHVERLHDEIEKWQLMRNLSYMGAGVGAVSLSCSIALPILFSSRK